MKNTQFFKNIVQKLLNLKVIEKRKPIYFKCPYMKSECTEYDSGSATLLTNCKDCANYDKGIIVSKF